MCYWYPSVGAMWRSRKKARIHVRRSKTDPEAEGAVLYIGPETAVALVAIMPEGIAVMDPSAPAFWLADSQIGRRVNAAAKAVGLGEGFTSHSGLVGMAHDLAAAGVELPELMTAGWWKSPKMPARYTEGQAGGRPGRGGQVLPGGWGLGLHQNRSSAGQGQPRQGCSCSGRASPPRRRRGP